jgi:hypothetical protein
MIVIIRGTLTINAVVERQHHRDQRDARPNPGQDLTAAGLPHQNETDTHQHEAQLAKNDPVEAS